MSNSKPIRCRPAGAAKYKRVGFLDRLHPNAIVVSGGQVSGVLDG